MGEVAKPTISVTGVMDYLISPKHYKAYHIDKLREPTQSMWDGVALHKSVLEPEKFETDVYVEMKCPEGFRLLDTVADIKKFLIEQNCLSAGKRDELVKMARDIISDKKIEKVIFVEDLEASYEKKIRLTQGSYDKVLAMKASVLQNKFVKHHYGNGKVEVPVTGEIEGVTIRGRMDWLLYNEKQKSYVILDLKGCRNARMHEFQNNIAKSNYHIQAWLYSELVRQNFSQDCVYAWIAVETALPHICEVYACDFGALEKAESITRAALTRFKRNCETGIWPGYTDGNLTNISIPYWAFNTDDEENE